MSWLLFLDESGTDHGGCPYEVTGGVAIHASRLWPFIKDVRRRERDAFGGALHEFGAELKGCKLLNRTSYQRASQGTELADVDRQRLCRSFLTKGLEHRPPNRMEFTAFGQARLAMAKWMRQKPSCSKRSASVGSMEIPTRSCRIWSVQQLNDARKTADFRGLNAPKFGRL